MTDTPNHDDILSLDAAIDDLLAEASSIATDPREPMPEPALEAEPVAVDASVAATSASHATDEVITGASVAKAGEGDGPESAPLDAALASSLDHLLKQANELQASVAEVAPPIDPEPPPPPGGAEQPARAPSAMARGRESPAPTTPDRPAEASSLQSLDAELAALTDDLLAGEVESGSIEPVAPSIVAAAQAQGGHAPATGPHQAPAATPAPVAPEPPRRRIAIKLPNVKFGPILLKLGAPMLNALRALLSIVAMPLRGKRTLQQSVGWLAAYTLFLAGGLWIYLVAFHTPPSPTASTSPSALLGGHGDGDEAGAPSEHGDSSHGAADHATEGHGPTGHDDGAGQTGPDAHEGGHGEAEAPHGAPGAHGQESGEAGHAAEGGHEEAGAHGPAKDAHGGARELTVVNGYAMSKSASAKAGATKPDAHGAAKKDAGHGAKKDAGPGAKKSGGH